MNQRTGIVTIGAYGWTADAWFQALQAHQVATLIDLRRRRGLRGAAMAWANATRLQARLAQEGVAYHHALELAPHPSHRQLQQAADAAAGDSKRERQGLSPGFRQAYREEVLAPHPPEAVLQALAHGPGRLALFCVEGPHEACHRHLAAEALAKAWALPVRHLDAPGVTRCH